MVLHDLNLAARYSDLIVVMKDGVITCQGTPAEVFTPEILLEVFGLEADVLSDPRTGLPIVVPTSSSASVERAAAEAEAPTRKLADAPHS